MAEVLGLKIVEQGAAGLLSSLYSLRETRGDNAELVQTVDQFVKDFQPLVEDLKKKLPNSKSPWAIESLKDDFDEATEKLTALRNRSYIRTWLDAKEINKELHKIREKVLTSLSTKLLMTNIELTSDMHERLQLLEGHTLTFRTFYKLLFRRIKEKLAGNPHQAGPEHMEAYAREGHQCRIFVYFKVLVRKIKAGLARLKHQAAHKFLQKQKTSQMNY